VGGIAWERTGARYQARHWELKLGDWRNVLCRASEVGMTVRMTRPSKNWSGRGRGSGREVGNY
jgi:hypothetical protein